jgi:hypothetical protein
MHEVWREHGPPAYVAVAAYLGFTQPKPSAEALDLEDLANFLSQFPGGARSSQG